MHTRARMEFRPITPTLGAEALGVQLARLSHAEFAELHKAWKENGILLVRGQQDMTDAQFEAFSRRFGELDPPPNQGVGRKNVPGHPELYVVSNELGAGGEPLGALGYSEAVWHTDMSYLPVPPIASMLLSRKLPAWGGNTWAASMVAAYNNLPGALKERVKSLKIKHDGTRDSGGNLRKGVEDDPNPVTAKGYPHPAVIRDPGTGYEHKWKVGDVLIWSNYSTMHKRDEFDKNTVRRMHRSQIKGTAAPAAYFS